MSIRRKRTLLALGVVVWIVTLLRFTNVSALNDWRNHQLAVAVQQGDVPSSCFLLELGADANLTVYMDEYLSACSPGTQPETFVQPVAGLPGTPLVCLAMTANDSENRSLLIQTLLEYGADPNASIVDGTFSHTFGAQNALENAVESDDESTVRVLLAHGAVVAPEEVFTAISHGNTSVFGLLLTHSPKSITDARGATLLQRAAENGNTTMIRLLIEKGARVDERDGTEKTALMFGARKGQIDAVKYLLDNGANPNAQDKQGRAALHWATDVWAYSSIYGGEAAGSKPGFQVVSLLQKRGARFDIKDKQGQTPANLIAFDKKMGWRH